MAASRGTRAAPTSLRAGLVRWFDAHARDLPWRRTRDPYAIWISEVMLQQTRVDTVIPYFERFTTRFPTVRALAAAPEDAVLSHWSGLGYYRRARQLHAAAKQMVSEHGGQVPEDREARLRLPGIGGYTAGAIGSIAFDREEPIVDGNVARVLSRVHALAAPLGSKESDAALWVHAALWVKGERPGALNQALMELGATICTPAQPRCEHCPLQKGCAAYRDDRVSELPVPRVRRAPKEAQLLAVRATIADEVVLLKSDAELFGGLYGLPTAELKEGASLASQRRTAKTLLEAHGLTAAGPFVQRGQVLHVLTHRRLTVTVLGVTLASKPRAPLRAFAASELGTIGVSTLTRKLLALEAMDAAGAPRVSGPRRPKPTAQRRRSAS